MTGQVQKQVQSLVERGQFQQALLVLHDSLAVSPEQAELWDSMAMCLYRLKQFQLSAESYTQAWQLDGRADHLINAAIAWLQLERYDNALALLLDLADNGKATARALELIGNIYFDQRKFSDAAHYLRAYLRKRPDDEAALARLSSAALLVGRTTILTEFVSRDAREYSNPTLLANLGCIWRQTGRLADARDILMRAVREHGMTDPVCVNLLMLLCNQACYDEALALIRQHPSRLETTGAARVAVALGDDRLVASFPSDPFAKRLAIEAGRIDPEGAARRAFARMAPGERPAAWQKWCAAVTHFDSAALTMLCVLTQHGMQLDFEILCETVPVEWVTGAVADATVPDSFLEVVFIGGLGFCRPDYSHAYRVYERYVLPAMSKALSLGMWERAQLIANLGYQMVQNGHGHQAFADYARPLGRLYEELIDTAPTETVPVTGRLGAWAYIVDHTMHEESPDVTLFDFLQGIRETEGEDARIAVFAMAGASDHLIRRFRSIGVEVVNVPSQVAAWGSAHLRQQAQWLRQELARRDMAMSVFFGTTVAFALSMAAQRIARVQLYQTVGARGLSFSALDGFLCWHRARGSALEVEPGGEAWWFSANAVRAQPSQYSEAELAHEAENLRRKYAPSGEVLLGSIARPVKLTDAFLGIVANILRARPTARFIYTGANDDERVRDWLSGAGVMAQCRFAGYVDPVLYAQVFDIHLDPFPYCSGHGIWPTWQAGRACVTMAARYSTSEGEERSSSQGVGVLTIDPLERGDEEDRALLDDLFGRDRECLAMAHSESDYARWAVALIDDVALRERVGSAARRFYDQVIGNYRHGGATHLAGLRHFWKNRKSNRHPASISAVAAHHKPTISPP
jgi:tetratricopeptide (TPR) repeat protein